VSRGSQEAAHKAGTGLNLDFLYTINGCIKHKIPVGLHLVAGTRGPIKNNQDSNVHMPGNLNNFIFDSVIQLQTESVR